MAQTYEEIIAKRREAQKRRRERVAADPVLREKERERLRRWAEEHKEQERERGKRRYWANKEKYKEKNSRWFREHRDWDNERKRKRYAANKEKAQQDWARNKHRAYLSPEKLKEIWPQLQNGPCEICGATVASESNRGHSRMSIDHNHATMQYRGILCHRCNLAIGHFQDNATVARKAAEYLERRT